MINKKIDEIREALLIGVVLITMVIVMNFGYVVAQEGNQSEVRLRAELSNLTSELSDEGYSWLVDYDIGETAEIGVYREGDDELIAEIGGVGDEGFYRSYLDGSSGSGLRYNDEVSDSVSESSSISESYASFDVVTDTNNCEGVRDLSGSETNVSKEVE